MRSTDDDLKPFSDWLDECGYAPATMNLYTHWVRRVLRDVPVLTPEALGAYLEAHVPVRYRSTCRSAWRALVAFCQADGRAVADFPPRPRIYTPLLRRVQQSEPADAAPLVQEIGLRSDEHAAVGAALRAFVEVTRLRPAQIPAITWDRVDLSERLVKGRALVPVPGKKGDMVTAPLDAVRTLRAWGWGEGRPPAGAPLVPCEPGAMEPAPTVRLVEWLGPTQTGTSHHPFESA